MAQSGSSDPSLNQCDRISYKHTHSSFIMTLQLSGWVGVKEFTSDCSTQPLSHTRITTVITASLSTTEYITLLHKSANQQPNQRGGKGHDTDHAVLFRTFFSAWYRSWWWSSQSEEGRQIILVCLHHQERGVWTVFVLNMLRTMGGIRQEGDRSWTQCCCCCFSGWLSLLP